MALGNKSAKILEENLTEEKIDCRFQTHFPEKSDASLWHRRGKTLIPKGNRCIVATLNGTFENGILHFDFLSKLM